MCDIGRIGYQFPIDEPLVGENVVGRLSIIKPSGDMVRRRTQLRTNTHIFTSLIVGADSHVFHRTPGQRYKITILLHASILHLVTLVRIQIGNPDCQLILQYDLVIIQRRSNGSKLVDFEIHPSEGPMCFCPINSLVDNATRTS